MDESMRDMQLEANFQTQLLTQEGMFQNKIIIFRVCRRKTAEILVVPVKFPFVIIVWSVYCYP